MSTPDRDVLNRILEDLETLHSEEAGPATRDEPAPDCLPFSRIRRMALDEEQATAHEVAHARVCPYCSRALSNTVNFVAHPPLGALLRWKRGLVEAEEAAELRHHVEGDRCRLCRTALDAVQRVPVLGRLADAWEGTLEGLDGMLAGAAKAVLGWVPQPAGAGFSTPGATAAPEVVEDEAIGLTLTVWETPEGVVTVGAETRRPELADRRVFFGLVVEGAQESVGGELTLKEDEEDFGLWTGNAVVDRQQRASIPAPPRLVYVVEPPR